MGVKSNGLCTRMNGHWLRKRFEPLQKRSHTTLWWIAMVTVLLSLIAIASGSSYVRGFLSGTLTVTSASYCSSVGGFGMGPSEYAAKEEGVISSSTATSACTGGNGALSTLTLTVAPFAGATNITVVDAFRFYWNGTVPAVATLSFSSSGTSFFTSGGPYGYLLVNSTTAGTFPVHSTDDCVGAGGISAPGTGNCKLQLLPLPTGTGGAVAASGTAGNTLTGLVNLSAPSTVVCPPVGASWNAGGSTCAAGSGGDLVASLAAGPSFLVISFGFSDAPNTYPGGVGSFGVTISVSVTW